MYTTASSQSSIPYPGGKYNLSMDPLYLAKVLSDLGCRNCDPNMLQDVLQQLKPLISQDKVEAQVANALIMMLKTQECKDAEEKWNMAGFCCALVDMSFKIDLAKLVNFFDVPNLGVQGPEVAKSFYLGLKSLNKDFNVQITSKLFFRKWKNIESQLFLIYNSLLLPPSIINFSLMPGQKILSLSDFPNLIPAARNIASSLVDITWNNMELFQLTSHLIETDDFDLAKPIFELASRQCPELLCIALSTIDPSWNSINREILVKLTCGFLLGQPSSSFVLPRIWTTNPNNFLFCMVEMYRRDQSCISRILDIALELKILMTILDSKPYSFSLELSIFAARRQNLNLEKWLMESLKTKGDMFLKSFLEFVKSKLVHPSANSDGSRIYQEWFPVFLKVLNAYSPNVKSDLCSQVSEVISLLDHDDHVKSASWPKPESQMNNAFSTFASEVSYPSDIEEEVNNLFDQIFARQISVPEIVEGLKKLRSSINVREQQIFACFLSNLLDEYRFFPQYPDSELSLTSVLFGQLINSALFGGNTLGVALKLVLDSLKKSPNQKLFKFGIQALLQFHPRLPEWPQYCSLILQIQSLTHLYPDLYNYLRNCSVSPTKPADAETNISQLSSSNQEQVNPLVEAMERQNISVPSDVVKDRILFILNNLSNTNLEAKANDFIKIIEESHYLWLAHYLVIRRASLEPNYHLLYLDFLELLQIRPLSALILQETYSSIYVLLRSSKILTSTSERSLLKNLGMWLGGLTLARDRPILHKDLSLKGILLDAYVNDRLIAIVPFICKVLEQSARSRAFIPENPWLMAILNLLVELYYLPELKLNLKFEIEVLFKNMNLELHSLPSKNLLRASIESFNTPVSSSKFGSSQKTISSKLPAPLINFVIVDERFLQKLGQFNVSKKIVALSLEYAIREVSSQVTSKAFQYAMNTTRTITQKDFSNEHDQFLFREAMNNMVSSLLASTSIVLASEALKKSFLNNLRIFFGWADLGQSLSDALIESIVDQNFDLGCAYIEKIALASSKEQIEVFLAAELKARPAPSKFTKLSYEQLKIFEDYGRKLRPSYMASLPEISASAPTQEEIETLASELNSYRSHDNPLNQVLVNKAPESSQYADNIPSITSESNIDSYFESIYSRFIDILHTIETQALSPTFSSLDSVNKLPPSHGIRSLMKQIIMLASSSPIHRDELCLLMSQKLIQGLYRTESKLFIDVIIMLLIKIFEFSSKAAKEVTTWVVHSTDERKYSVPATTALFGSGLIYVLDFDSQLAKQIEISKDRAIDFAIELIRNCVFKDVPVAAPYDFVYTLESLGKLTSSQSNNKINALLHDIATTIQASQPESQVLRDQITFCFTDWFRLCQYPSISEKLISSFVSQLFQRRFLENESSSRSFFQICTELCIELYVRQRRAPAILSYRSIDAFARLVGQIIKYNHGVEGLSSIETVRILTIVNSVAGLILVQGLDQGLDYLQRPFSRLFVSLAYEVLGNTNCWSIVDNICSFYSLLGPKTYPSFAFAWFELICNRPLLIRLLENSDKGWKILLSFLTEYFDFAFPIFEALDLNEASRSLYRGVLRLLLIILHDCPQFFVIYGKELCSHLHPFSNQLKNVILSAIPEEICSLSLPDPVYSNVETILSDRAYYSSNLPSYYASSLKNDSEVVESFLLDNNSISKSIILSIEAKFANNSLSLDSYRFAFSLVSSLVDRALKSHGQDLDLHDHVKSSSLFEFLLLGLQISNIFAQYSLISVLIDQMTYPCPTTNLTIMVTLNLFEAAQLSQKIKEIIVRSLLERLIVHRPHPWGVMVTFIEIVRNPKYRFWSFDFSRSTPDIEKVFESISRGCLNK